MPTAIPPTSNHDNDAVLAYSREVNRIHPTIGGGSRFSDDRKRLIRTIIVDRISELADGRLVVVEINWAADGTGSSITPRETRPDIRAIEDAYNERCIREIDNAVWISGYLLDLMDIDIKLDASPLLGDRKDDDELCGRLERELEEAMRRLGPVNDLLVEIEWLPDGDPAEEDGDEGFEQADLTDVSTRTESREREYELNKFLVVSQGVV